MRRGFPRSEGDDRAPRARDRLLGLVRWAGWAMRIAVAIVNALSEASPASKGGRPSASSSKPSAYAQKAPATVGRARTSGGPSSSSTISNAAVFLALEAIRVQRVG